MEIKIGIQQVARELVVETDEKPEAIETLATEALAKGEGVFSFTDSKGKKVVVAASKLAYIEIGSPQTAAVGFRA